MNHPPPDTNERGAVTVFVTIITVALLAVGGLVADGGRILTARREAANVAIRDACKQHGLMFLDDTVGLASLRPARNDQGHAALRRVYRFEYSETGDNRKPGTITLLGSRVLVVALPVPAPLTIVPSGPTLH